MGKLSGFEIEKLQEMIQGMTEDQQRVIAETLPDEILWGVLYGKYLKMQGDMVAISQAVKG